MSEDGELPLVRRSGKSEAAFRTISEVADELDVPQHVLRFWESKFTQVRPLKRGGGRRYYRPEDVALLRRIRDLLYSEGYTIKGVQKLLREGGHKEPALKADSELPLPLSDGETEEIIVSLPDEPEEDDLPSEPIDVPALVEDEVLDVIDEDDDEILPIPSARFSSADRLELQEILAELECLRELLQPR